MSDEKKETLEQEAIPPQASKVLPQSESKEPTSPSKPEESDTQKIEHLIDESHLLVNNAYKSRNVCRELLRDDLAEYKDAKLNLKEGGLDLCHALLAKMGYPITQEQTPSQEIETLFDAKEIEPLVIKDVSSGKFTAILASLVVGVSTAIGLIYLATEKLSITLNVTKIPSHEITQKILGWFSGVVGIESNLILGASILGLTTLLSMGVVYLLRVILKTKHNLHFATTQFEKATLYAKEESECKRVMDGVDRHIKESLEILKSYEILLNEQQGKLKRILHLEGEKSKATEYHQKSYEDIRMTKALIDEIEPFITVPMSDEGKLSKRAMESLKKVKNRMDETIERLYHL